jgi:hypothetical protein
MPWYVRADQDCGRLHRAVFSVQSELGTSSCLWQSDCAMQEIEPILEPLTTFDRGSGLARRPPRLPVPGFFNRCVVLVNKLLTLAFEFSKHEGEEAADE